MNDEAWRVYRCNLPHFHVRGAIYFVTRRLRADQQELAPPERSEIARSLRFFHCRRYLLDAYVVMNDHVHVLVQPFEEWPLEKLLHSWKSFTAHALQRKFSRRGFVWLDESFDRIVRDEAEWNEKLTYIMNNPLEAVDGVGSLRVGLECQ